MKPATKPYFTGADVETYLTHTTPRDLPKNLSTWKVMRDEGWDATVLLTPDKRSVVTLGCRLEGQLSLLAEGASA